MTQATTPASIWDDGITNLNDCVSVAVTEKRTRSEIDGLAAAFAALRSDQAEEQT